MGINNIIYLSELVILILAVTIGVIVFERKHKKGLVKFLGLSIMLAILAFGVTYLTERPEMDIKNNITLEVGTIKAIESPKTIYHFKDVTESVKITGDIDYSKVGTYEANFELDTLIGKYTKTSNINIIDTEKPKITLKAEENYKQSYKKDYAEPGFEAVDNYDGDITEKVKVEKQDIDETHYILIYKVEDSSSNETQVIRNIELVDDIVPEITLNGNASMTILINGKYQEKGAKAIDEKDGDLTNKIETSGAVDTSKIGTYTIVYKVSDKSGNEASKKRTIYVVNEEQATPQKSQTGNSGKGKIIYLTFDDGPSTYTNKLLDILKKYNVKATFFVTGNGSDAAIKREYDEGHTVGLHTNSHNYGYVYKNPDNFFQDLYAVQARVERITGHKSFIMRFPGGSSNTVSRSADGGTKIMSYLTKEVEKRGFTYFDWNVSSGDAGSTTSSDGVYRNVVNGLKYNSNVVLQHDIKGFSVNAVERIIQYGLNNGYTFMPLTESSYTAHHGVNN